MRVRVDFAFVAGVSVIVRSVIPGMVMRVRHCISRMVMFVLVFVCVLVRMDVRVLMSVLGVTV